MSETISWSSALRGSLGRWARARCSGRPSARIETREGPRLPRSIRRPCGEWCSGRRGPRRPWGGAWLPVLPGSRPRRSSSARSARGAPVGSRATRRARNSHDPNTRSPSSRNPIAASVVGPLRIPARPDRQLDAHDADLILVGRGLGAAPRPFAIIHDDLIPSLLDGRGRETEVESTVLGKVMGECGLGGRCEGRRDTEAPRSPRRRNLATIR